MKILFLSVNLREKGGIQRYNKSLLKALSDNGVKIILVQRQKGNFISKIIFIFQAFVKTLFSNPDFIIASHANFSPLCFLLKRLFGKEYVVLAYGIDVWEIKDAAKIRALKESKKIIAISNYTRMRLISKVPEMENKIFVLPNPVDGQKFYPALKSDDLIRKYSLSGYSIILTVARLAKTEQYKGYDKVIEALPLVLKKNPRVKYFLIGKGDDEKRVRDLIGRNNLKENVIISGGLTDEELVKYYNLCDLFIMPSKGEGFGFVFLEALACAKPVISGNQDASPEPLLGGELGLLVNPDSTAEIADAIIKILDKKAPLKILDGQYLRKRVLEVYGLDKFKEKVKTAILS